MTDSVRDAIEAVTHLNIGPLSKDFAGQVAIFLDTLLEPGPDWDLINDGFGTLIAAPKPSWRSHEKDLLKSIATRL